MGKILIAFVLHVAALASSSQRLDAALVARGLCASRAAAKTAITSGLVTVDGVIASKVALSVSDEAAIAFTAPAEARYVSRAGPKLEAALSAFDVDLSGAAVLDVGASTGGFTDCALQAGAASVVCVDCGHDQLVGTLRDDPRVTNLENLNARSLTAEQLPRASFDCVVVDVSFISLTKILPAIWPLLDASQATARLIALVKPQFECGKAAVSKGKGLVKDTAMQEAALHAVASFASEHLDDCAVAGSLASPILGGDGQKEFLLSLAHVSAQSSPQLGPLYGVEHDGKSELQREATSEVPIATGNDDEPGALEPVTMRRPETAHARKLKRAAAKRKAREAS